VTRGEIWTVDIPAGNGHEQAGLRPVLIMSEIEANVVVVVPLTSNMAALRFPHTLQLMRGKLNCLKGVAVALVFQIRAIGRKKADGQLHQAVNALVAGGFVERTIPGKPNSRLQEYRLTEKGCGRLAEAQ